MGLIKYRRGQERHPSLIDNMLNMEREMQNFLGRGVPFFSSGNQVPAVNITESEKDYHLEVAAPGLQKNDIKIDLDKDFLSISCEKENRTKINKKDYTRREFNYQNFQRSFTLPENARKSEISAEFNNGVLNITIPKLKPAKKPQRIKHINIK